MIRVLSFAVVVACASCAPAESIPAESGDARTIQLDYNFKRMPQATGVVIDFILRNPGDVPVRDVRIECTHASGSGARIASNSLVIEGPIPPNGHLVHDDFDTGFTGLSRQPADTVSCKASLPAGSAGGAV